MERLLDIYFTSAISDIIIEMQKDPLLRISIEIDKYEIIEEMLDDIFDNQTYDIRSLDDLYHKYISSLILGKTELSIINPSPAKYNYFDEYKGYETNWNFKYGETIYVTPYKPNLEFCQQFVNALKNDENADFHFGPREPGTSYIHFIRYNPYNKTYTHTKSTGDVEKDYHEVGVIYKKQLSDKKRVEIANEFQRFIDQCKEDLINLT